MSVLYRLSLLYFVSVIAFAQLTAQTGIPRTLNVQGVLTSSFGSTPLKGKQVFRVGIYESVVFHCMSKLIQYLLVKQDCISFHLVE
jgi:hypothetical protein